MNIKKYIPQELVDKCIDLTDKLGVFELVWNYNDVMEVIKYLEENEILILGGDVLNKEISYTYDNWSYEGKDYKESIKITKDYINSYSDRKNNDYYYVLVIEDKNS